VLAIPLPGAFLIPLFVLLREAAPEQSEDAPKDRDRESRYGPHRSRMLLESRPRRESKSGLTLRLPFKDECGHRPEKPEQNQLGRILITHSLAQVGRSAGFIIAASTVGSIAGVFVAGYVLIDEMNISTVFRVMGGLTILLGVLCAGMDRFVKASNPKLQDPKKLQSPNSKGSSLPRVDGTGEGAK